MDVGHLRCSPVTCTALETAWRILAVVVPRGVIGILRPRRRSYGKDRPMVPL